MVVIFKHVLELESKKRVSASDLFSLLDFVQLYGSISKAASRMGVSYRYAWGLLQEAEKSLGMSLLEKHAGGFAGGGALLTAEGRNLLQEYKDFMEKIDGELTRFMDRTGHLKSVRAPVEPEEGGQVNFLLLASTLELVETGLMDELEKSFFREKNILVRHLAAGSGRALDIARGGRVDMVFTHAPDLEQEFISEGWGAYSAPIMSSDYLLAGPGTDPAGLRQIKSPVRAREAFGKIARSGAPFVTRGDHSGTHLREVSLWEKSGITPGGEWYHFYPGVAGNLGALRYAREKSAYMLTDTASYYLSRLENEMEIFVESGGSAEGDLANIFTLTLVNPRKVPSSRMDEALSFARWLQKEEGRKIIKEFGRGVYTRPLFNLL